MSAIEIVVPRGDASLPGVYARPACSDAVPGVVIAHEILGLTPHIRALVERFAAHDIASAAVNLFAREGHAPPEHARLEDVQRFAWSLPDARVVADLCAAGAWLGARDGVRADRIALVGFSYGATSALHVAASDSPFHAIVAFYPKPEYPRTTAVRPVSPIDRIEDMRIPVHAHFGGLDRAIPPDEVERFRTRLLAHDPRCAVHVYAGSRHGFFNESRKRTHDPSAAQLAWARLLALLSS